MRLQRFSTALLIVSACGSSSAASEADSGVIADVGTGPDALSDPSPTLDAESCAPVDPAAPTTFTVCSTGSGSFGRWTVDDFGLPAYDYTVHQDFDDRAIYPTTDGNEHRDHWSAFGNDRLNAILSNDGVVQVFTQDRGPTWLDVVDDDQGWFGGGFSWIDDGAGAPWASAYRYRPIGAKVTRRFGSSYAETSTEWRSVAVTHRFHAPSGDVPYVVDDVILTNTSDAPVTVRHYEAWDVARRQLQGNWFVSGAASPSFPQTVRNQRDALSAYFDETPAWDPAQKLLRITRTPSSTGATALPAPDAVSDLDAQPGDPFLAQLVGDVAEAWTDQSAFFGTGTTRLPDAVKLRSTGVVGARQNGAG
ncbi:MAG: hypothetical protein ACHREM_28670, partial [Polyangiales bacterium]